MMGKYEEAILCSQQQLEVSRKLSNKVGASNWLFTVETIACAADDDSWIDAVEMFSF